MPRKFEEVTVGDTVVVDDISGFNTGDAFEVKEDAGGQYIGDNTNKTYLDEHQATDEFGHLVVSGIA